MKIRDSARCCALNLAIESAEEMRHNYVGTEHILYGLVKEAAVSMQKKAEILVEAAVRENTHSQDNTSVALLQYIETKITKER